MDDDGLVRRVEVFWQTPWLAPPGADASSEENTRAADTVAPNAR
jgi:hypothetical protein